MNFSLNSWDSISMFYSAVTTQNYLSRYYIKEAVSDYKKKSYENTPTFINYIKSAEMYYTESSKVAFEIQPVLLFYGYIQLIKACLLSIDPFYPSSSSLLAHGVTTRKRKKQQYEFLNDDVKIQRNGLFPYMSSKMFHVKRLEGEKLIMNDLLFCIPELAGQFRYFFNNNCFMLQNQKNNYYIADAKCLDDFHMSADRLTSYLNTNSISQVSCQEEGTQLLLQFDSPLTMNYHQPFHFDCERNQFAITNKQATIPFTLNEMLIHYLLLYNLSMIARYESDWWMDLNANTPNEDYPFIKKFLKVTLHKGPLLIKEWLLGDRDILYRKKFG